VPYALLLPNMLIFGFFTFVPMILNFYVSMTSGSSILLFDRPWVGFENYTRIFNCENIFEPRTCSNEGFNFWTAMFNTLWFVVIQVPLMCVVALATALVVNKNLQGRGFWRAMFFYPVMLSPVVIANIWHWMLHRRGALNEAIGHDAGEPDRDGGAVGLRHGGDRDLRRRADGRVERALRSSDEEPSLAWTAVFAGLFALADYWANPLSLLGLSGSGWMGSRSRAGSSGRWRRCSPGRGRRSSASGSRVLMLLSIQFDGVFAFDLPPGQLARHAQHRLAVLLARLRLLLEPHGLLHADPAGGLQAIPRTSTRPRRWTRPRPPAPSGGSRCRS
jgi:hypothetical protein